MGKLSTYIAHTEQDAWVSFIVACCIVDKKDMSMNEMSIFGTLSSTSAMLGGHSIAIFKPIYAIGHAVGSYALIDGSVSRIHPDDRMTLFTYCVNISMADGVLNEAKKNLLKHIAKALQITQEFWECTIRVMWHHCRKNNLAR